MSSAGKLSFISTFAIVILGGDILESDCSFYIIFSKNEVMRSLIKKTPLDFILLLIFFS